MASGGKPAATPGPPWGGGGYCGYALALAWGVLNRFPGAYGSLGGQKPPEAMGGDGVRS